MKYLFLSISLFALYSCKTMEPCTLSGIEDVKMLNISAASIELELTAIIKNPNNFGFNIYPSDFDISIADTPIGKAGLKKKLHINANSEIKYKVLVKSDMSNILSSGGIASLMRMMQSPVVGVKGELRVGTIFYKKKFPVDIKESISLSPNKLK